MNEGCSQLPTPGAAVKWSKGYAWAANGSVNLDKQDFLAPLRALGSGAPMYLDTFGIVFQINVTAGDHDLPYNKIPQIITRCIVRDPIERFNLKGMSWAGVLVKERQGWTPCGSATAVLAAGATANLVLWMPFPTQVEAHPADCQYQYDHWWSLDGLYAGEVAINFGTAAFGEAGHAATLNSGTLYFYASAVERTAEPAPGATSPIRPLVGYWKDYPITINSNTAPLTPAALVRYCMLYHGDGAVNASLAGTVWAAQQISSGAGRFNATPDYILSAIEADKRQGLNPGLYFGTVYANGFFQVVESHPDSDVTDYIVADSFDYLSTVTPTVANGPVQIMSWYGDRAADTTSCSPR